MGPVVVIPAIKKSVAFPDDLVKKLAGITLIQRAIYIASCAFSKEQVHVVTDSEEIGLICYRNDVAYTYDQSLVLDPNAYLDNLYPMMKQLSQKWQDLIVMSPYVPMLTSDQLLGAYEFYEQRKGKVLIPVVKEKVRFFSAWQKSLSDILHEGALQELICESNAFTILNSELMDGDSNKAAIPLAYPISGNLYEITNYEDWWICEKLLNRKRIVFNVIGHKMVGMGHIYRCLALAHEISDHEIRFVCDKESQVAAKKIAGTEYWVGVYDKDRLVDGILELSPDLVVNDVLSTQESDILKLKQANTRVLNFEDLGEGATKADLVINDLYEDPQCSGENILWGHEWFFVRDEFASAGTHAFKREVKRLLIAFGGTDPTDLTRSILFAVVPFCRKNNIAIDVVTGDGYQHKQELEALIQSIDYESVTYTHATGVISHIMENTEIAICSNGRTVYELAHMNVPSIVLSHHERETTHYFACEENGFIPLGILEKQATLDDVVSSLKKLVEDVEYRHMLFSNQVARCFTDNKHKVIQRIQRLLLGVNNG